MVTPGYSPPRLGFVLSALTTLGLTLAASPARLVAQHETPDAATHVALASANAVVGALSAGLLAWARGEEFARAFAYGAAGGTVSYAGKAIAATDLTAAPLVGRQVAAVGHSVVANAAAGAAPLREVWLPLSPLRVRLPVGGAGWGAYLDLFDVVAIAYGVATPELRFDAEASAWTGSMVFTARGYGLRHDRRPIGGFAVSGVQFLSGALENEDRRRSTMAHEAVHAIQSDFLKAAWSHPIEQWLGSKLLPGWRWDGPVRGALAAPFEATLGWPHWTVGDLAEREAQAVVRMRPEPPLRLW